MSAGCETAAAHGDGEGTLSAATNGGRPGPQQPEPVFVGSWQQAELNAAQWMRHWGYPDAKAAPGGADRGIDVRARGAFGQVKNRPSQAGRPDIQRLLGATIDHPDARLFFFSAGGFSKAAVEEADGRQIALFTFVLDGTMTPVNRAARGVVRAARDSATREASSASAPAPFLLRNWRALLAVGFFAGAWDNLTLPEPETSRAVQAIVIGVVLLVWNVRVRRRSSQ